VTAFALRGWSADRALVFAATLQTGGTAVAIIGVELESTAVALIGTVVAGFANTSFGLRPTTLVYGVVVVAFGVAALVAKRLLRAERA
jgi:MFS-type transporter involved in bile tolerance (Atg22 family)